MFISIFKQVSKYFSTIHAIKHINIYFMSYNKEIQSESFERAMRVYVKEEEERQHDVCLKFPILVINL